MSKSAHRIVQIHVTRKCNLKCRHCYSSSGPEETEALDIDDLLNAITDAKDLGYTFVTLSGGEPFLYPGLHQVLAHAKSLGLVTGLVTNGMFLDERRLSRLQPCLDLVVISLDGAPERHNAMRLNPAAFQTMERKLPHLKKSGIPFGFLFTLSDENAHELDWAADFAADTGAAMLQVHPLETEIGRAAEQADLNGLDPSARAALEASRRALSAQRRIGAKMRIIVDFRPRTPTDAALDKGSESCGFERFCDLVPTLCIETDGTFVPMGHGFSRAFEIGRLGETSLIRLADKWKNGPEAERFAQMVRNVRIAADDENAPVLQNMAQSLRRASFSQSAVAAG